MDKLNNFRMGGFGHVLSVHFHDDVIFPDSGAVGGTSGPDGLDEDRLISGQGQSVTGLVTADDQGPGTFGTWRSRRMGRLLWRPENGQMRL